MLTGRAVNGLAGSRVKVLVAFALAERIEGQHHVTFSGQSLIDVRVVAVGLAVRRMPQGCKDSWEGAVAATGKVQIGGDVDLRVAFKNDLFDPIGAAVNGSGDARVQRGLLKWTAQKFPDCGTDPFNTGPDVGLSPHGPKLRQPPLARFIHL